MSMFGYVLSFNSDGKRKRSEGVFRTKGEAQNFAREARKYQRKSMNIRVVKATRKEYTRWVNWPKR